MTFAGGLPGTTDTLPAGSVVEQERDADLPAEIRGSLARTQGRAVVFLWTGRYRIAIIGQDIEAAPRGSRHG